MATRSVTKAEMEVENGEEEEEEEEEEEQGVRQLNTVYEPCLFLKYKFFLTHQI